MTIEELQAEVKRANISLDAQIQENTADKAAHAKALADLKAANAKEAMDLRAKHKKEIDDLTKRMNDQHAAALAKAIADPPEVRAIREKQSKLIADHATAMKATAQELHAAMHKE